MQKIAVSHSISATILSEIQVEQENLVIFPA